MRYQLTQGFVIGSMCITPGTTIDLNERPEAQWSDWDRLALGHVPPTGAIPLDEEARQLIAWTHHNRAHPLKPGALPAVLEGIEFELDQNRVTGWRRKAT